MISEHFNSFLKSCSPLLSSPLFVFITGASGAGKTYLAKALEQETDPKFVHVVFFDTIRVPPLKEMVEKFGSRERWQEAMTHKWIEQLSTKVDKKVIILEGQYRPHFALEACKELGIGHYVLILAHADRKIRDYRLIKHRKQPELANDTMENWAMFLKASTKEFGGIVMDTSDADSPSYLNKIMNVIKEKLQEITLK